MASKELDPETLFNKGLLQQTLIQTDVDTLDVPVKNDRKNSRQLAKELSLLSQLLFTWDVM